jgi:hypothetical protein
MNAPTRPALAAALMVVLGSSPLVAQVLHVNDRWKDCAFEIHPSLTQETWRQFVGEVGLVSYFRPLVSARPLGARRVEFALLSWSTRIDAADAAWNDTFSHPDSTHWLFDGDALPIPGLMLRAGVTDRVDAGAYFTKNVNSNYGIVGAQVQYSLLGDAERNLAAAGRVSVATLFGPEDLSTSVYGLEMVMSRDVSVFSPYAAVSGYLARGREHTSKVDLESENVFGVQGTLGVAARISVLRLGAEVNLAQVPGYSFKLGFGS